MMHSSRKVSIRSLLIGQFVLVMGVTLALVLALMFFWRLPLAQQQQFEEQQRMAQVVVKQVQSRLDYAEIFIEILSGNTDLKPWLENAIVEPGMRHLTQHVVNRIDFFQGVYWVGDDGVLYDYVLEPGLLEHGAKSRRGADLSNVPLVRQMLTPGAQRVWSDQYLSPLIGQPVVALARPLPGGMVIAEISVQKLTDTAAYWGARGDLLVLLTDSRGELIASPDPLDADHRRNMGNLAPISAALESGSGHGRIEHLGDAFEGHALRIDRLGWVGFAGQPLPLAQASERAAITLTSVVLVLSIALGLLLNLLIATRIGRHLRRSMSYSDAVARGEYEAAPPRSRITEVLHLERSLNSMAIEVRRREQQVLALNTELEGRVQRRTHSLEQANAELVQTLDTLRSTQDRLLQADKLAALGSLVAGVAHEINTPIGNALMAVSTLSERLRQFQQRLEQGLRRSELDALVQHAGTATDIAERNLSRAADLVSSFKQVAVDQTSAQRRRFQLDEVVREILLTLQPQIRRSPFVVEVDVPADIWLDSYPGPLGQVLSNLIQNALLHGLAGRDQGRVRIEAQQTQESCLRLSVADDGCGIPAHLHDRVFEPFFTTRLGQGGSGLGLPIVHNLVTGVLGGRLELESNPGLGTRFLITCPLVAPREAVAAPQNPKPAA